jgi:hypothetical protein
MRTKAFHAFEQKLSYFNDDIELIDIIRSSVIQGDLSSESSQNILNAIDPMKHPHLQRRKNSEGSRKLIINHLRATLYSSYVKDVYEEVTHYLKTILEKAAQNGFQAGRIIGEHSFKIDAKEILETGSWESITKLIADSVFQSLENERSTLQLLKKIKTKLSLDVDEILIDNALPYLEVRHCLVHRNGKPSPDFIDKYPHIRIDKKGYIALDISFIYNLRDSVNNLVAAYDNSVISSNLLKPEDTQP